MERWAVICWALLALIGAEECPDGGRCGDGHTCCSSPAGGYDCCPYDQAVCCADKIHCCPGGSSCDLERMTCIHSSTGNETPMGAKLPAGRGAEPQNMKGPESQAKDIPCDATSSCPDDATCCKTTTGEWACCPFYKAVCCNDHLHCCPADTVCDLATLTCDSPSRSTPMRQKTPTFVTVASAKMAPAVRVSAAQEAGEGRKGEVQCDARTSCPRSTTCCFIDSANTWGCCQLPEAVCCADGSHCCPAHYQCDERRTSCTKGRLVIPWYTKISAISSVKADPGSVRCDAETECPEHTTCCQKPTGEWGCCPIEDAVCCPDKEHCCPMGYSCNTAAQTCDLPNAPAPQWRTVPPSPLYRPSELRPRLRDVKCDDETSCQDGQTCCKLSATVWGCCPMPNAVCCSDMQHCCPSGFSCTPTGDCTQGAGFHWQDRLINRKVKL
ncbi:progranulin-like [Aulostomus maculatus]